MKLNIRKIYCSDCHRLVWGKHQQANGAARVSCPKCGKVLWAWVGVKWKYGGLPTGGSRR